MLLLAENGYYAMMLQSEMAADVGSNIKVSHGFSIVGILSTLPPHEYSAPK
jgi:hypothetical protein